LRRTTWAKDNLLLLPWASSGILDRLS